MIYITREDLETDAFERLINESTTESILDRTEGKVLGIVSSYLSGRYDAILIFDPEAPIRDELLADIVSRIVLYRTFRRNAARKVPEDVATDYGWAMKELLRIQKGETILDLPAPLDGEGNPESNTMFGNNTNEDFYI